MIRGQRLTGESRGAENIPSVMLTGREFMGREEVCIILHCLLFTFKEAKNGGPPPIEGIGGGPSPAYPLDQCMTFMAGTALIATTGVAGAAVVVRARTGPATSEPTVPTVRMAGARMFRRMRMSASMRLPRSLPRPWIRRPGHERRCSCFSFTSLWLIT